MWRDYDPALATEFIVVIGQVANGIVTSCSHDFNSVVGTIEGKKR